MPSARKLKQREYQRRFREKNKRAGMCSECGREPPVDGGTLGESCREKRREYQRRRRAGWRRRVHEAYGGACSCCGEDESLFLTIDHVNGGGRDHMRDLNSGEYGASRFYLWLIDHDFPSEFQLLCFNCNSGKHLNGGTCPHQLVS